MDPIDEEPERPNSTVVDLSDLYYNDNGDKVEVTKVDIPQVQVNGIRQRTSNGAVRNSLSVPRKSLVPSPRELHQQNGKDGKVSIPVDEEYIRRMTVRTIFRNRSEKTRKY